MKKNIAIIGLGLMGGSLAAALKKHCPNYYIRATDKDVAALKYAKQQQWIDDYSIELTATVKDCDIIFLAVPLSAMAAILQNLKSLITPHTIISDLGSVKQSVIEDASHVFKELPACFIPGHPIAGSEKSGVQASNPLLFQQRTVVLTPLPHTDQTALNLITEIWQALGAKVHQLTPEKHDEILALTSHLPHALAFNFLHLMQEKSNITDYLSLAGSGFTDFTRIGHSDPIIWRDICLANSTAILDELQMYQQHLTSLQQLIQQQDATGLQDFFSHKKFLNSD